MIKKITLFCLIFFSSTVLLSQVRKSFSTESSDQFMKELDEYMSAYKNKKTEKTFRSFKKLLKSGVITQEDMDVIMKSSNDMLHHKLSATPYYANYFAVVTSIKKHENGLQLFEDWHEVIADLTNTSRKANKKEIKDFLTFSLNFFEEKALRKGSAGGTTWMATSDYYQLKYKNGTVSIHYDNTDLIAHRKKDSLAVYNTQGIYYPSEKKWIGQKGHANWERFDTPEVFAEFGEYTIECNKSIYTVEKVQLTYPLFFGSKKVEGKFSDKLVNANAESGSSYPRFESFDKRLRVDNFGEGIGFLGGFKLHGKTILGYGDKKNKARIDVRNKYNKNVFFAAAENFVIRNQELITGKSVEMAVYFGRDSIYHPSIDIRYDINKGVIKMKRGQGGNDRNPFYDSYHDFHINSEYMDFYVHDDSITIGKPGLSISKKAPVEIESLQYFNENVYNRIQSIAAANPLAIMAATAYHEGTNFLDSDLLASRINSKFTTENIQTLLYDLVSKGFINYYPDEHIVEIRPKLTHYVESAKKTKDYDNLRIYSDTKETNAAMKLGRLEMLVDGVKSIEFSAKQRVGIKPYGEQIVIQQKRDFAFHGKVFAGFSVLKGKDFVFEYEKFQIRSDSMRYAQLYLPTGNMLAKDEPEANAIASKIEKIKGVLLIDAPNNKSGKEDIPIFPSLQSKDLSYVTYQRDSIFNNAYPRDSFFYELTPFSLNKLDELSAEDLVFKGQLISMDIFPNINEDLRLREDMSLGFIHPTPNGGLPVYQGKGDYKGDIDLSNNGLLGEGNLQYLGASIDSKDIVFKPKNLLCSAEKFELAEERGQPEVPKTYGVDVTIDWKPYSDSMYVKSEEKAFDLFNDNNHTLEGIAILTPGGLKGDGIFDWDKATMQSKQFDFGAYSVHADTTSLKIKAFDSDELALHTSNVKGDVDFDEQIGTFDANKEDHVTTLPYNKYITSMSKFDWDMQNATIKFINTKGKWGSFTSIHPEQDSLFFWGSDALYDIKSSELRISGVPHINTADAIIYADSNYVEIHKGGVMQELQNAQIVANTVNKNHVINRATVRIKGRRQYEASGFYEYNIADKEQEIEFEKIVGAPIGKGAWKDKKEETRATGQIEEGDEFYIDHKTKFQGTISLNANNKELQFDGFCQLEADKLREKPWFTISSKGDKKDLTIRYEKPLSIDGQPIRTGLFLSKERAFVYPKVMSTLLFRKDRAIFPAVGVFNYNEDKDQFIFGDSTKVIAKQNVGNILIYDNRTGNISAEGKFNIGSELKVMSITAAGIGETSFAPIEETPEENNSPEPAPIELPPVDSMALDSTAFSAMPGNIAARDVNLEVMTGIDMILPEALLKEMIKDFQVASFDSKIISYITDINYYKKAASELFPANKDVTEAINGMASGYFDMPKKHNPYTFLFSRLKLKWDTDYQSFVTTDKNIGLATINGENINKKVECYIEFKMPSNNDDRIYMYFVSPSKLYYFLGYKQGVLNVVSNNPDFMAAFNKLKGKDKSHKLKDGVTYEIQAVEASTAQRFLRRIQAVQK